MRLIRVVALKDGLPMQHYVKGKGWQTVCAYEGTNVGFARRFIDGSYAPEPGFSYKLEILTK